MNHSPSFNVTRETDRFESGSRMTPTVVIGAVLFVFGLVGIREPEGERQLRKSAETSQLMMNAAQIAHAYCPTPQLRAKAIQAYLSRSDEYTGSVKAWTIKRRTRLTLVVLSLGGAAIFLATGCRSILMSTGHLPHHLWKSTWKWRRLHAG